MTTGGVVDRIARYLERKRHITHYVKRFGKKPSDILDSAPLTDVDHVIADADCKILGNCRSGKVPRIQP